MSSISSGTLLNTGLVVASDTSGNLVVKTGATDNTAVVFDANGSVNFGYSVNLSASPTLNSGTTNGVAYLNGSKVLTTGSALSFNGSQLGVVNGAGTAIFKLDGTSAPEIDFYSSGVIKSYIYAPSTSLQLNTVGSNPIIFLPNESEGMRLTTTGLGIGTSSPATKLNIGAGGVLRLNRSDNATYGDISYGGAGIGILFNDANNEGYSFRFGGTDKMRLDTSGNLGLSVTPSAWGSTYKAIQVGSTAVFGGNTTNNRNYSSSNVFWNGSSYRYITTSQATQFEQSDGAYYWLQAASGTAGNAITFTQAMILDASGNLGIGTSSPSSKLTVSSVGSSIELKQSAIGSATYYVMDNTVETGGKRWRFGYSGAAAVSTFSLLNITDNVTSWVADASGNLGLGVTPSAWATITALQVKNASFSGYSNEAHMNANYYYNAGGKYIATDYATRYVQTSGQHAWYNAPSGTAGNAITFTQAMTLDASGNLGIGTTSPTSKLTVGDNTAPAINLSDAGGSLKSQLIYRNSTTGNFEVTNTTNAALVFGTNNTERARISSAGYFGIGTTNPTYNLTNYTQTAQLTAAPSSSGYGTVNVTNGTSIVNNGTVDVLLMRNANGTVLNGSYAGHVYIALQGTSGVNDYSAVYYLNSCSNSSTNATFGIIGVAATRGTSPVSSVNMVSDGSSGAVKIQITYVNNAGITTGTCWASFVGIAW